MANMKPLPKAIIIISLVAVGGYTINQMMNAGYFTPKPTVAASVPPSIDLPVGTSTVAPTGTVMAPQQSKTQTRINVATIPWNATMGLQFANGDVVSSPDSLMAKNGISAKLTRYDEYPKMIADQVKFAKGDTNGATFAVIMGDGYPGYVAGLDEALGKPGQFAVIGALGYSRGEDACMMTTAAYEAKGKGSLIAGVLGDGDINICIKWASDNRVPVNPDITTYDPAAMNFVATDSFVAADQKFISGACETREVVNDGKKTGKKTKVCVSGTATWTPGDVNVAREAKDVVKAASTADYIWQMPSVVIGYKPWMEQNPEAVKAFLAAAFEGGEAVRSNDAALQRGAEVSAKVYAEQDAAYWKKYFKGTSENIRGRDIKLGGSTANGLSDNLFLFGLNGNDNLYKRVYNVFGKINATYFPDMLSVVKPYEQVVDTRYIVELAKNAKVVAEPMKPTFANKARGEEFASGTYSIEFDSGKATFKPAAITVLNNLLDELAVSGLAIQVNGHTDTDGTPASNLALSKARAEAVKDFLVANAGSSFSPDRITTRGFGDTQPVADNTSPGGKAKNRRVVVVLRKTN